LEKTKNILTLGLNLTEISKGLLLEQDSKLMLLRKAISDRIPVTINYKGPSPEVLSGQRADIEPIVLGKNAKSGNLVIWAYVFKGTSKKGLPGWKMFRVDRIDSVKFNLGINKFKLTDLPGYQKGKAPNAMKSLSSVDVFSPYWFEDDIRFKKTEPTRPAPPQPKSTQQSKPTVKPVEPATQQPTQPTEPQTVEKPEISTHRHDMDVYNSIKPNIKDINGQKIISTQDYQNAVRNLYSKKEGDWKNYQKQLGGNVKPGQGTRQRFDTTSKNELDSLLSKDNIKVSDEIEQPENLSEMFKRFKVLINSK
jgi:hypothetical protein